MKTCLETDRLMMRRTRVSDLEDLHRLVSDFDVVKGTASWPWPADRRFTATRCTPVDVQLGMAGPVFHNGTLIGMMGAMTNDAGAAELGYMFTPRVWGQGFATEMARALIDHCWARYDWAGLHASAYDDNPSSVRVLQKLGFVEGPPSQGPCVARGCVLPLRCFTLRKP